MILIQNIYYMLSYAFKVLKEQGIKDVDVESFDHVEKLCAEILIKSVNVQIKRGLRRDYLSTIETMSSVKGKMNISESIKTQSILKKQIVCSYDSFSPDIKLNQIIKATFLLLLQTKIELRQKKAIRSLLIFFDNVSDIDIYSIDWNLHYDRSNQSYQMIITICYLVVKGLLQTQSDGTVKLMDFFDEQRMSKLYEKFILEYYKTNYPQLSVSAPQIHWKLDNDNDSMLPIMKSDIMLEKDNNVLIIDAKCYSRNTQKYFDKYTIFSGNLYQIFTYVKNKDYQMTHQPHRVSGMLLYAKTDDETQPDAEYMMSGNKISVKTLDLNQDFSVIEETLNKIILTHFYI